MAVVAVVSWQTRVLMVQRRYGEAKGLWALPGGFMDAGEMPEDALTREVREEAGLAVRPERLLDILPMEAPGMGAIGIVIAYAAPPVAPPTESLTASDDAAEARWFAPDALPAAIAFKGTRHLIRCWQGISWASIHGSKH